MAEKSGSDESTAELRREIARSRDDVGRDVGGLQYELDFPLKIRKSFQRNTVLWVGSALALGLLIALLRARTQKVFVNRSGKKMRGEKALFETGLLVTAVKLAMPLIQPVITSYFAKKGAQKGERHSPRR